MDKRMTLALETLTAIEEAEITSADLRQASQALGEVGKRWIVEGGQVTSDDDHEAHNEALERGSRLCRLAEMMDALAWLDEDDE